MEPNSLSFFLTLGVSLTCYNCLDPVSPCRTNITCSPNQDSCLIAVSGRQIYQQCWKYSDCNSMFILSRLDLLNVQYRCCQLDMCNKKLKEDTRGEATSLSGKTALLGTSVLAAIWRLCF
ncbi:CD59 glycoprotein [Microtus ochrogaster]|uniref:MAC-inhibitory protein n=1 Tax=Microtus ochrogaster TaxID=79684 RepID=A0A8J6GTK6_MICOH|nr:CD59 glycoprotein [Microtus ochrogaster]